MSYRPILLCVALSTTLAGAHLQRCPTDAESEAFLRGEGPEAVSGVAARSMTVLAEQTFVLETSHFSIAYQKSGPHAVAGALVDVDKNGHPDNIDAIGRIAEHVWRLGVDTLGYIAPLGRDSLAGYKIRLGGKHKYSIEVGDMPTFSSAWATGRFMGFCVRPNVDPDAQRGGELVIENDFIANGEPILAKVDPINTARKVDSVLYDYSLDPLKGWQATIAHEFYHALQYQYDEVNRYAWHEATATWFATRAFPEVKHHWQYLASFVVNNSAGPFTTWDSQAPYYNYGFVSNVAKAFGVDVVRRLWLDHGSNFEIEEDHWFSAALTRLSLDESDLIKRAATEYLKLVENVPGVLNDSGEWKSGNYEFAGKKFSVRAKYPDGEYIAGSSQAFGNMYVWINPDQFKDGLHIKISGISAKQSSGVALMRLPSGQIETFVGTYPKTYVVGSSPLDTAWRFAIGSGLKDSVHDFVTLDVTTDPVTGVQPRVTKLTAGPNQVFDLRGRPVTSSTRGIILEGNPETGWRRRVILEKR